MDENQPETTQDESGSWPKKKWRKKRKNFLSNARKYGKKGQMGRGAKIPDELYEYFVGILNAMTKGIQDEEERETLVNNVLERTTGDEVNMISNQLGSRIIEQLLPYASVQDLERFTEAIDPHLRRMVSDNFTSHIIETLLHVSCNRATDNLQGDDEVPKKKAKVDGKYPDEHIKYCYDFTVKVCKYALNNLEDFVWDPYANHILRSSLKCLSGITLLPGEKLKKNYLAIKLADENKSVPPHDSRVEYREVPPEFKEMVRDFARRLIAWPQFRELPNKDITSGLLQVLLYACKNVDKHITRDLIKKLLDESFVPKDWESSPVPCFPAYGNQQEESNQKAGANQGVEANQGAEDSIQIHGLPPVFQSQPAVRLLESSLCIAKPKMYTELFARCFASRLARLAARPAGNFAVQRLLDNCTSKEQLEAMFEELAPALGAVLARGSSGVLLALCKASLRLGTRQAHFLTHLEAALQCSTPERQKYLAVACLRLQPCDQLDVTALNKEYFIHVHGSVMLQTIMNFQRPGKAVNSLLDLEGEELLVILCDAKGCHVADALCAGPHVGVRARDKLIWRMKGLYQKMALSQYGSRAFEKIYQAASHEQKTKIMAELADKSSLLLGTQYGKLIAAKLDLAYFKKSQSKWEERNKVESNEK